MREETEIMVVFGIMLFVLLIMAAVVMIVVIEYNKRRNADQLVIRQMEDKYEKELLKTQLEVQEQTLEDISREMHDYIGSKISIAKAHAQSSNPAEERLRNISDILKSLQTDVRGLSRTLSIDTIRASGLTAAVEQLVDHLGRIGHYEVQYSVVGNYLLMDEKVEIIAFRILQESVNNILKHAKATKINITMTNEPTTMCLKIEDNGCGINLAAPPKAGGITNIRTRAALIEAELKIENSLTGGTRITLCIPITKTAK